MRIMTSSAWPLPGWLKAIILLSAILGQVILAHSVMNSRIGVQWLILLLLILGGVAWKVCRSRATKDVAWFWALMTLIFGPVALVHILLFLRRRVSEES